MRLIDIDKRFEEWQELLASTFPLLPCQMPHQFFLNAPTVDAVPVIRCKDCMHWNKPIDGEKDFSPYHTCKMLKQFTLADFFCQYGAKMDLK